MKITTITTGVVLLCSSLSYAITISTQTAHPYTCENCEHLSHESLTIHWPIHDQQLGHQTQHQQISKKYTIHATWKEIEKGIDLYTQAPGAIIRISSAPSQQERPTAPAFKPEFYIKTQQSGLLKAHEASSLIATDNELSHSYFSESTPAILQLKPELGAGKMTLLATPAPGHENDKLTIHIFDKNAPSYLRVETNKAMYHYGEQLTTTIALGDDLSIYPLTSIQAMLVNPEGETIPLDLKENNDHSYTAIAPLQSEKNNPGDNWYVEAKTTAIVDDNIINRQAHTAFTYAIPSAVIHEINQTHSTPLTFTATINVATASRYALQAVLFKTDEKGNQHPVEVTQSASWLTPGNHEMNFSFSPDNKNASPLGVFYVSAIQLIDYGQIKPVFTYHGFIPVNVTL